jgi:hypothetical protein
MNPIKIYKEIFVELTLASAIILLALPEMSSVYTQSMSTMKNSTAQQHAEHTLDNLIVSEHIPLTGR